MNILITPDVLDWAIGALTKSIVKHQKYRFNFYHYPIHPRNAALDTNIIHEKITEDGIKFDLWHAQYWRSSEQAMDLLPDLKDVPKLLTVHNHNTFDKPHYDSYDAFMIATEYGERKLLDKGLKVSRVPYGIDVDRYPFIEKLTDKKNIGYIGRVMPHKNLHRIARVAKKLGAKVIGSGYIEKPDYLKKIDMSVVDFMGGIGRGAKTPAYKKDKLYQDMMCFVMYSTEEIETGTLPLLEAMASGVPVLATAQGMARDLIKDGENGFIFKDETELEEKLKEIINNEELRNKLRENAWNTVRNYSEEKNAREVAKVYYKTMFPGKRLLSVIIPTFERADTLVDSILSVDIQDYDAKEIIVVDDNSQDDGATEKICKELKKKIKTPLIYLNTGSDGYNLAMARNIGAIEALGEILVFMDDRFKMKEKVLDIISQFYRDKTWYFGRKIINGKMSNKEAFIENFSWIKKKDYFQFGGCNERVNIYGAMSQELRHRISAQGMETERVDGVVAEETRKSRNKHAKKKDIWKAKYLLHKMYE